MDPLGKGSQLAQTEGLNGRTSVEQASFRDPAGSVFLRDKRVFRIVTPAGKQDLEAFLASPSAARILEKGQVVSSTQLADSDRRAILSQDGPWSSFESLDQCTLWEHERIPFPSFPYEWPPTML